MDTDGDGIREKDGQKLVIRWLTYPSRQELPLLAESVQATLKAMDDGFYPYLVDGAALVGAPGIPMLMDPGNTQIPKCLIYTANLLSSR